MPPPASQPYARDAAKPVQLQSLSGPLKTLQAYADLGSRVEVYLYERPEELISGTLVGFDSFFNLVLEDVEYCAGASSTKMARILLKASSVAAVVQVTDDLPNQ